MPATVQLLLLSCLLLFPFLSHEHTHTHALTPKMAKDLLLATVQQEMENESTATGISTADASSSPSTTEQQPLTKTEANTTCITTYCQDAALACVLNKDCRTALSCLSACDEIEDDTPDKIHLQNCTALCVCTYENAALDDVNACFDSHECIELTPIDLPCREVEVDEERGFNVTLMEGEWWATYGKNEIYDCYLCQRLTFSPLNQTTWLYDSKYITPTLTDTHRAFELQAPFPWPEDGMAKSISFNYTYQGMSHGETWKFLHVDSELVILYYCGFGNTWQYEGGLVLSRSRSSDPSHIPLAEAAFEKIGFDFHEEFCKLEPNSPCPGFHGREEEEGEGEGEGNFV